MLSFVLSIRVTDVILNPTTDANFWPRQPNKAHTTRQPPTQSSTVLLLSVGRLMVRLLECSVLSVSGS